MKIGIASDHRGYHLKQQIKEYLAEKGYNVVDYGTNSTDSVDYSDFGFILGKKLVEKEYDLGIGICGTGIGISIACNKVKGVRCAKVDNSEEAVLARSHNNANIVAINSRKDFKEVKLIVNNFIETDFSSDKRHLQRIRKITKYEAENS
jgi:ribose 5-phosphate isomerase B